MEMHCWNYLDTVEVIGSIPVAPTRKFNRLGESTWPAFSLCAQTGAQIAIEENGSKTLFADSKDSVFVASTTIHNPRTSFPDQAAFSTSKCLELLRLTLILRQSAPETEGTALRRALRFIILIFAGHKQIALENDALRQQLALLRRTQPRAKLRQRDRLFWIVLMKIWKQWRNSARRRATRCCELAEAAIQAVLVEAIPEEGTGASGGLC